MLETLFGMASPQGVRGRLSVLIFHRVLAEPDPLLAGAMHARQFEDVCRWMADWFNVLPLDEAVKHLKAGSLPSRAASISFDDGYADNCQVAMPILQKLGLTATFFISTGFLDGGRMWNDSIVETMRLCPAPILDLSEFALGQYPLQTPEQRRKAISGAIAAVKYKPFDERVSITEAIAKKAEVSLPTHLMLTSQEVVSMRQAGMQIGAHTVSHPILAKLTSAEAEREILDSRNCLEALLGERIGLFAYPNGKPGEDYSTENAELVRSLGFDAGISTAWGASGVHDDIYQIKRFTPWDRTRLRFGLRMLTNLYSSR